MRGCILLRFQIIYVYLQICERSLTAATGGPAGPSATCFVRAEMLPSGYLIRPCDGGGSLINMVDHFDLDVRIQSIQLFMTLFSLLLSFIFVSIIYLK